jgi:hypothetical protein
MNNRQGNLFSPCKKMHSMYNKKYMNKKLIFAFILLVPSICSCGNNEKPSAFETFKTGFQTAHPDGTGTSLKDGWYQIECSSSQVDDSRLTYSSKTNAVCNICFEEGFTNDYCGMVTDLEVNEAAYHYDDDSVTYTHTYFSPSNYYSSVTEKSHIYEESGTGKTTTTGSDSVSQFRFSFGDVADTHYNKLDGLEKDPVVIYYNARGTMLEVIEQLPNKSFMQNFAMAVTTTYFYFFDDEFNLTGVSQSWTQQTYANGNKNETLSYHMSAQPCDPVSFDVPKNYDTKCEGTFLGLRI